MEDFYPHEIAENSAGLRFLRTYATSGVIHQLEYKYITSECLFAVLKPHYILRKYVSSDIQSS